MMYLKAVVLMLESWGITSKIRHFAISSTALDQSRSRVYGISFCPLCNGRSNFLGTKFTIYDAQPPNTGAKVTKCHSTRIVNMKQVSPRVPAGNYPVAHISYELNVLGSRYERICSKVSFSKKKSIRDLGCSFFALLCKYMTWID